MMIMTVIALKNPCTMKEKKNNEKGTKEKEKESSKANKTMEKK